MDAEQPGGHGRDESFEADPEPELGLGATQPRLRLETRVVTVRRRGSRHSFLLDRRDRPLPGFGEHRTTSPGPGRAQAECGRMCSWTACTTSVGCKASVRSKSRPTSRCSTNRGSVGRCHRRSTHSSMMAGTGRSVPSHDRADGRRALPRLVVLRALDHSGRHGMVELGLLTVDELEQRAGRSPTRWRGPDPWRRDRLTPATTSSRLGSSSATTCACATGIHSDTPVARGTCRAGEDSCRADRHRRTRVPDVEYALEGKRSEPTYRVRFESRGAVGRTRRSRTRRPVGELSGGDR